MCVSFVFVTYRLGCVILRDEFICHVSFSVMILFSSFLFAQACHNLPDTWCELLSCRLTRRDRTICSVQSLKSFNSVFLFMGHDPSTRVRRAKFSHIVGDLI